MLILIIIFSILGSVGAILAAFLFIYATKEKQELLIPLLVSFAIGVLLTAAFLGLIPEAIEAVGEANIIMPYVIGGIVFFFIMEKFVIWRNCRNSECERHTYASGPIILFGDALHNLSDGVVIAAAFLINLELGLITSITIIIHEVAQETGDFGVLLHSGYSQNKALLYNMLSSLSTIPAAIIAYFLLQPVEFIIPYLIAFSAASFIYIALSDLTPDLHKNTNTKHTLNQILFILIGITVMAILITLGGHSH
ncbi:MAG: ZIP family metal transporter [Promethearchaeota archaeon]